MITSKEAQLNEFFENGMSPAEEQNFLISVAASDELRIAFRSHLELMKAVRSDKDNLRNTAQIRNRTLAALGLSATAASQFLEHGLMQGKREIGENAAKPLVAEAPSVQNTPGMQWVGHLLHVPALTVSAGLLLGILSTAAVEHYMSPAPAGAPIFGQILPKSSAPSETIPSKNGLHSMDNRSVTARSSESYAAPVVHRSSMALHHPAKVAPSPEKATISSNSARIPEISKNNPGVMQSRKIQIHQTNDTATVKQ